MTSFSDDFNRADSTALGAGWVEVSGDWSIVSNQLSPGAAGGTIVLRAAGAMASNDHYAQVTIATTTAASQGVWCRGDSTISNGYLWRNNGTSWDLFSVVGGSFVNIGTYAAAAAPGDVAKVQAVGSTIKAFVNGVERLSVTNTAVTTGTSVGIRGDSTSGLRYDNFAAADIGANVTGTGTANFGGLTATASGVRTVTGTVAGQFGALAGSVTGVRTVVGSAVGTFGGLLATAQDSTSAAPAQGSWYGLLDIIREATELAREERERDPVACPNDGEPLESGPDGQKFCPFDGWRPSGRYVGC